MTARPRAPSLKDEHIIDTAYNLPLHWRVCRGLEWGAFRTAFLAFHVTQRVLGRCVERSVPWISAVERGRAAVDDAMVARLREAIEAIRKEQQD